MKLQKRRKCPTLPRRDLNPFCLPGRSGSGFSSISSFFRRTEKVCLLSLCDVGEDICVTMSDELTLLNQIIMMWRLLFLEWQSYFTQALQLRLHTLLKLKCIHASPSGNFPKRVCVGEEKSGREIKVSDVRWERGTNDPTFGALNLKTEKFSLRSFHWCLKNQLWCWKLSEPCRPDGSQMAANTLFAAAHTEPNFRTEFS